MFELLTKKSEAESRLLSGIANKLGDPSRKIASKAGYLLSQLLLEHPAMKPVVVREVRGPPPNERNEVCPTRLHHNLQAAQYNSAAVWQGDAERTHPICLRGPSAIGLTSTITG